MNHIPQFLLETPLAKSTIEREKQAGKELAYVKIFNITFGTEFITRDECDAYQEFLIASVKNSRK